MAPTKDDIAQWFMGLQDSICTSLEIADGKAKFIEDIWERPGGGGGRTRLIQNGAVLEKGGVNFSAVHGPTPSNILKALNLPEAEFFATGVSIVQHPINPQVPIIHMNVRYFEMGNGMWWFGGGIDLTPHYVVDKQAAWFHRKLQAVCDAYNPEYYPKFKHWADDYFYIKHRQETRGVGGIFFDRLSADAGTKENLWNFTKSVGSAFADIYTNLMQINQDRPYTEANKRWQKLRRGRYVEFNLVWDKGTKFGLDTDGRTESILMSMPPEASWEYMHEPTAGSPESGTLSKLIKGIDWVNIKD